MRTLGMLGGMSWESTAAYYRIINETVAARLGGLHSARLLISSVDFAELAALQERGEWERAGHMTGEAAAALEMAGADGMILCCNTLHRAYSVIASHITVPFLHIAEVTAEAVAKRGIRRAALLGTRYTMEPGYFSEKLAERDIETIFPEGRDISLIDGVIYGELCRGVISPESKAALLRVIDALARKGAEGVILGCTELELLIKEGDAPLPIFDTTELHARAAAEFILEDER